MAEMNDAQLTHLLEQSAAAPRNSSNLGLAVMRGTLEAGGTPLEAMRNAQAFWAAMLQGVSGG